MVTPKSSRKRLVPASDYEKHLDTIESSKSKKGKKEKLPPSASASKGATPSISEPQLCEPLSVNTCRDTSRNGCQQTPPLSPLPNNVPNNCTPPRTPKRHSTQSMPESQREQNRLRQQRYRDRRRAEKASLTLSAPSNQGVKEPLDPPDTPKRRLSGSLLASHREGNRRRQQRYRDSQRSQNAPDFRQKCAAYSQNSYHRKSDADRARRLAQMHRINCRNRGGSKQVRQCRRFIQRGMDAFTKLTAVVPKEGEEPFDQKSVGQLCSRLKAMQPGKRYRYVFNKYVRLQQRQRLAVKLNDLLNDIARDIDNPSFDKPEYAQLLLLGKKVATITNPEQLTSHVKFVDESFRKMKAMKSAATTLLEKALAQLRRQVTANVIRHPEISDDEYTRSVLYRLLYHVKQPSDPAEDFETLEDLFPVLYHEQLTGKLVIPPTQNESTEEIDTTLVDGMTSIAIADEFVVNENLETDANLDEADVDVTETGEAPLDPAMAKVIEQVVAEENEEELAQFTAAMQPVAKILAQKTTLIRRCSSNCPDIMSTDEAKIAMNALLGIVTTSPDALRRHNLMQKIPGLPCGILQFIRNQAPCSSGCRTILKRLMTIRKLVDFLTTLRHCLRDADETVMRNLCAFIGVPAAVVEMVGADFTEDDDGTLLTEGWARKRYGAMIDKCRAAFAELEIFPCDICDELKLERELETMASDKVLPEARIHRQQKRYTVCLSCRRQMQKGKLPVGAVSNALDFEECPPELKGLNWLEKALIQLVRPVQNLVTLTDKAGRKTNVVATRGALVVLPVPTNGTMQHVAETLPSTANLNIIVRTDHGRRLVSLPRVLRALHWLKANNPHYEHINIDDQFRFSSDGVHFEKANPTQADFDNLIELKDGDVDTILMHDDIQVQPVMDTSDPVPAGTSFEQYTLKKSPWQPFDVHDPTLDVRAFPWLFPYGTKGSKDTERPRPTTLREYVRHVLALKDRRIAQDSQYLCFNQGLLQQQDMLGSMGISARMNRENLTGAQILKAIETEDPQFQKCLASNTASLRCFQPYWDQVRQKVKAHTRIFKAPTLFLTLNPSLTDWEEVHKAYEKVHGVPVDKSNIAEFIAKDPYIWTRHFQHRFRSIMDLLLDKKNGPFGEIAHYFYRIEYQARGTEHVHMLIWLKDAPKTTDTAEKITEFIDRIITARLPDQAKEPELYDLVTRLQMHNPKCTNTCKRYIKYRGKVYQRCRFEFPRKSILKTKINKKQDALLGIRSSTTKYYTLRRRKCDTHINDYNPAVLLAWRGNIDVQFISPDSIDIIKYITGYTTKNESGKKGSLLQESLNMEIDKSALFQTLLAYMKQRETGVMEVVDWLMGHHMYGFDVSHVKINNNAKGERFRMMKKKSEQKDDDSRAYVNNMPDVYYPNRAKALEDVSIFTMYVNFVIRKKNPGEEPIDDPPTPPPSEPSQHYGTPISQNLDPQMDDYNDDDDFVSQSESDVDVTVDPDATDGLDNNNGPDDTGFADSGENNPFDWDYHTLVPESPFYCFPGVPKRTAFTTGVDTTVFAKCRAHVPSIFWPHLEDENEKSREDYFRRLCFMFIPWRDEDKLMGDFKTYEDRWIAFFTDLGTRSPHARDDIAKIIDNVKALMEADREVFRRRAQLRQLAREEEIEFDAEDESLSFHRDVDEDAHAKHVASFNPGQREIFDHVMQTLEKQATNSTTPPLRMFVSGTAGTGKTHLIKGLADAVALRFVDATHPSTARAAVLIGAPTGLAAIQIGGATLHRLFKLEVQRGANKSWNEMTPFKLNECRVLFSNVKLIIIDEISMCSNINLLAIHRRLDEIFGTAATFGGINLICFGDLLQLPPVLAPKVFKPIEAWHAKKYFGTFVAGINLWKLFDYRELTENMRQKGDLEFAEIMGRLRTEQLTAEDHAKLQERVVPSPNGGQASLTQLAEYFLTLQKEKPTSMALFPTRAEVQVFNMEVVKQLDLKVVRIPAVDSEPTLRKPDGPRRRIDRTKEYQVEKKDGVPKKKAKRHDHHDENDGRKAGGLEKELMVAVGCRIMLTRNIPLSSTLVNGSTGVLQEIVFDDTDTTKAEPRALSLKILFDRIPTPVLITPESTVYDVGFDKQVTRSQFPVVMAYAATIHKSQGLTLPNALISTANIFAPGQAFVGFSRVENINGLHLADYDPTKMFADVESLEQYNVLRQTVNLPPFPMPPPRAKPTTAVVPLPSVSLVPTTIGIGNTASVKAVVPPLSVAAVRHPDDGFLRLNNVAMDCFVNSAVNALHACSGFVNLLLQYHGNDDLLNELKNLFVDPRSAVNAREFRKYTACNDDNTGDPEDIFNNVYAAMTDDMKAMFGCTHRRYVQCGCDGGQKREVGNAHTEGNLFVNLVTARIEGSSISFADVLRHTENCTDDTCHACGQARRKWTQYSAGPRQRYLRIQLIRPLDAVGRLQVEHPNITGHKSTAERIIGAKWNLVAVVEYHRRQIHYTCTRRGANDWVILNDDRRIEHRSRINNGLLGYTHFLYEKK